MVVLVKDVAFKATPSAIGTNKFIDGVPSLLVIGIRLGIFWRIGDHLPPKKTVQVISAGSGNHAVGNVEGREAIMIKIPGGAGPRPAAPRRSGARRVILETIHTQIVENRVAHGVLSIESPGPIAGVFLESFLFVNAIAARSPHIRNVEIKLAVVVVVQPGNAHTGANILHASLFRNIREGSVAVVAIEILAAEIIDYVKVRPLVAIGISPGAAEAEASVVRMQARLLCDVAKRGVPLIAHQEVRRAIFCVEVWARIAILIRTLIIDI